MKEAPFGCNTIVDYVEKSSAVSLWAHPLLDGSIHIRPMDGIKHRTFDDFGCSLNDSSGFIGSHGGRAGVLAAGPFRKSILNGCLPHFCKPLARSF